MPTEHAIFGSSTIEHDEPICVVRLRTEYWTDKRGVNMKKSLLLMRRVSGCDYIIEDAQNSSAQEVVERVRKFSEHPDGLYEVNFMPLSRDYETGDVDDYDYILTPYVEGQSNAN